MGHNVYAYPGLRTGLGTPTTEGAGHGRRKPVTRVSTIGASQARIQRKVLVAIGAVAATTSTGGSMRTCLTAVVVGVLAAGCANTASTPSQGERQALAPTGKLRVASQ